VCACRVCVVGGDLVVEVGHEALHDEDIGERDT
jgi:hypothetical protein